MTNVCKACEGCRARKTRCDGEQPCFRCSRRGADCIYRTKNRNRERKSHAASNYFSKEGDKNDGCEEAENGATKMESIRGFHVHSVAAVPTSWSSSIQLHYGPSSTFSMMYLVYRQLAGIQPPLGRKEEVAQVGPGLDFFQNRSLFFGDIPDTRSMSFNNSYPAVFLNHELANRLIERYLATYWHMLPIISKDTFRARLLQIHSSPGMSSFDSADNVVLMAAMALGASLLGEEEVVQLLFRGVKQSAAKYDELVNIQSIHIQLLLSQFLMERSRPHAAFMHIGNAVRKAVAAGLHIGISIRGQPQDTSQRRLTFWCVYIWETWICFCLGRPTAISDPGLAVPLPADEKFIVALVKLSRIASRCASRIYGQHQESLSQIWNAVNEIRNELDEFAEEQHKEICFDPSGSPQAEELGFCQTMISAMYNFVLMLMFRPFLVLRAKLRSSGLQSRGSNIDKPYQPLWLDDACSSCLSTAQQIVRFMTNACEVNEVFRGLVYFGFFIEAACYVLGFEMLSDGEGSSAYLPYMQRAVDCVSVMVPKDKASLPQVQFLLKALQHILSTIIEKLQTDDATKYTTQPQNKHSLSPTRTVTDEMVTSPEKDYPTSLAPSGDNSSMVKSISPTTSGDEPSLTSVDIEWDWRTIDIGNLLSMDSHQFLFNMDSFPDQPMI
ncbi:fungal-specific transcription factor domain-containing protein [Xylogone sp. PMI_703]|nr:fungal-specific transcription factor domain-containing protein [Xylogone sp. PMI_703]